MDTSDFTEHRPLMFSIAYRMTGSVSDAEDIVQEAFLRLTGAPVASDAAAGINSPRAYLATITTRLAIDHLRSARVRRESYVGTWLPEPLIAGAGAGREATFIAPVCGRDRVAEVIRVQFARTIELGVSLRAAWVNAQPGILAHDADGGLIAVIALDVLDGQVQAIRTVANPEKLRHLGPISRVWHLRDEG
jgi:RNA polymerase sigma factor (sigma-70 family)